MNVFSIKMIFSILCNFYWNSEYRFVKCICFILLISFSCLSPERASLWMETMKTKRKKRKRYIKGNLCSRRYFQEKYVFMLFLFNQLQENKLNIRIARLCQKISAKIMNKILIIWKLISLLFFFLFAFYTFISIQ